MGALPRPDLPPGPHRELVDALHGLHHRAGWPSLRVLAREAGCSPTTVSTVFSSPRLPSWGLLELLVEAMGGDVEAFRALWQAAGSPVGSPVAAAAASTRIAGRVSELATVRRHLTAGEPGLLLVTGEAGIGKTRLVDTARAVASDRVFVAAGSCLPLSTDVPLLPIAAVLRATYDADHGQWFKEALTDAAPYVSASLRRLLPELDQIDGRAATSRTTSGRGSGSSRRSARRWPGWPPCGRSPSSSRTCTGRTRRPSTCSSTCSTTGPGVPVVGTWRKDDPTVPAPTRRLVRPGAPAARRGRARAGPADPRRDGGAAGAADRRAIPTRRRSTGSTGARPVSRCSPSSSPPRPATTSRCPTSSPTCSTGGSTASTSRPGASPVRSAWRTARWPTDC